MIPGRMSLRPAPIRSPLQRASLHGIVPPVRLPSVQRLLVSFLHVFGVVFVLNLTGYVVIGMYGCGFGGPGAGGGAGIGGLGLLAMVESMPVVIVADLLVSRRARRAGKSPVRVFVTTVVALMLVPAGWLAWSSRDLVNRGRAQCVAPCLSRGLHGYCKLPGEDSFDRVAGDEFWVQP